MPKSTKQVKGGAAEGAAPGADGKVSKKLNLSEEIDLSGGEDQEESLKVCESYAKRYNKRKDREELERANRILAEEDSESTEEEEDETAELLTDTVEDKIFETLNKIKSKDPAIYDKSHVFFKNEDFDAPKDTSAEAASSGGKKKKLTYGDMLRETLLTEGADAMTREDDKWEEGARSRHAKKFAAPVDEQKELRKDILAAAHGESEEDDDDLFTIKEKCTDELKQEAESFAAFTARKDKERSNDADDIVARYWKADEDLGENERFLRDFILNKTWMESTSMQVSKDSGSEEEEEHLEKADEYEKEYNFRFEMEGGEQIQGHKRFQENSVRERPDRRKRKRQELKERKAGEKVQRIEELKRLKNLKKQEIARRLKQLQEVTGNAELPLGSISLDADFDPASHDSEMGRCFNEDYEQGEEELAADDLIAAPRGCDELDVSSVAEEVVKRRHKGRSLPSSESAVPGEGAATGEGPEWEDDADEEEGANDPEVWWLCDDCGRAIPGGTRRFDCEVCENYTLCAKCFRVRRHPHKFKRARVPATSRPPRQEEIAEMKGPPSQEEEIEKILDEHFQLDYEDIIGGDLPTRFKYRKVDASNFGFTPEEILTKTDKELNKVMPLKKITRSYRDKYEKDEGEAWQGPGEWIKKRGGKKKTANGMTTQRLGAYNFDLDKKREIKRKLKQKATRHA